MGRGWTGQLFSENKIQLVSVIKIIVDATFALLLQALRQLGAIQMLDRAEDDAETSLLRAARLGSTSADQGKVRHRLCTTLSTCC